MLSEKEKMLSGLSYDANYDESLKSERTKCKLACQKYNKIDCDKIQERTELLKNILGKTKDNLLIEQPFYCDYGYNIEVGKNFYANHNLVILDPGKVIIGDNVFIGPNCGICTAQHPIDAETRNKGLEYAFPIKIGSNVWLGGGVTVLAGVTIGDNCVIGAGSVVNKDIPPNTIAAGNPCKVIRTITEDDKHHFDRRSES